MNEEKKLATTNDHGVELSGQGFMIIKTLDDAYKVSEIIAKSSFCPKQFMGKAGDVLVAIQMGAEVGLKPMQALQNIAVINGRPSLWGDAMLAVCRQSSQFEYITERFDAESNSYTCKIKRRNEPEFITTFSKEDAEKAGLWGKQGPWIQYPKRMLQMRARGFALRDAFPDLLRGMITVEEARDYDLPSTDYSHINNAPIASVDPMPITAQQFAEIKEKIKATDSNEAKICEMLKIEKLEVMDIKQYDTVNVMLDKKIARMKPKVEPIEVEADLSEPSVVSEFFEGVE